MYFIYVLIIAVAVFTSLTTKQRQAATDAPAAVASAASQVNQYRMFMYVAAQYMQTYSGGAATLKWAQLVTVATAPSGARNIVMPGNWKVIVAADNSWLACTQMDEAAVGMIQQFATAGSVSLTPTTISNSNYIVVGSQADVAKAKQCT